MIATNNNKYSWINEFSIRNNENSKEVDIIDDRNKPTRLPPEPF
tara:strand:+ start:1057 stop:1188 length:132 start_codon:yes stop_codon:yes gene_type:complete